MSTKTKPVDMLHGFLRNKIFLFALTVAAVGAISLIITHQNISIK